MITRLAHVCLGSTDLALSEKFYTEILGMPKKFDFIKDGNKFGFYLDAGNGTFIEIFAATDTKVHDESPLRHFCLETEDIDAVARALTENGFAPTEKKLGADESWQIWVESPEGVRFEFHEYTPQSHQRTGADCVVNW